MSCLASLEAWVQLWWAGKCNLLYGLCYSSGLSPVCVLAVDAWEKNKLIFCSLGVEEGMGIVPPSLQTQCCDIHVGSCFWSFRLRLGVPGAAVSGTIPDTSVSCAAGLTTGPDLNLNFLRWATEADEYSKAAIYHGEFPQTWEKQGPWSFREASCE